MVLVRGGGLNNFRRLQQLVGERFIDLRLAMISTVHSRWRSNHERDMYGGINRLIICL